MIRLLVLLLLAGPALAATPQYTPIPIEWFSVGEEGIPAGPALAMPGQVEAEVLAPAPPAIVPAKPMIAIVIDDMGVDVRRSARALDLPPAVTVSYLPYAPKIATQAAAAKARGHEVLLHMPMQAQDPGQDAGPHHLSVDMTPGQIRENTAAALDSFAGYDGVNNHMGSKFTSARAGLEVFMAALKARGVFFLDSKTAPTSVAEDVAREQGVPTAGRDIFLDHVETPDHVAAALRHTEAVAKAQGAAIAIGHPKDVTLAALGTWLAGVRARGFDIVPLSTVIKYRNP